MLKIYNAYRLKKASDLWEFSRIAKVETIKAAKPALCELFRRIVLNPSEFKLDSNKLKEKMKTFHEKEARFWVAYETIVNAYKKQEKFLIDNPANFDSIIGFWEFETEVFLMAHSAYKWDSENIFKHLETNQMVEPFWFDETVTKPEQNGKKISKKDWSTREYVWKTLKEHSWTDNLKLNILSTNNLEEFMPMYPDSIFNDTEALEIVGVK